CTLRRGMRATWGRRCSRPAGRIGCSSSWNGSSRAARHSGLICVCPSTTRFGRTPASRGWWRSRDRWARRDETVRLAPPAGCRRVDVDRSVRAVPRRLDTAVPGRTLGVTYLVSGSVRRAGPRLRVTVQLVRAADGLQVWGDVFDRSSGDLLSIGEENARAVAAAVAGRLLPAERSLLTARPTRQPGAYDHFLRGNFYLAQRTARAEAHAVEEYEAALRLDPEFGAARGRIAQVYGFFVNRGWSYPGVSAESLLARGLALADRMLRSDSTAADAWLAR